MDQDSVWRCLAANHIELLFDVKREVILRKPKEGANKSHVCSASAYRPECKIQIKGSARIVFESRLKMWSQGFVKDGVNSLN
ncbi:hypothetical protein ACN0IJ_02840 [Shewanella indica]|uniref:hypothetical protein n=1 Tax=Shewanella indica TaxID=768528 RepID=UPI00399ACCAE